MINISNFDSFSSPILFSILIFIILIFIIWLIFLDDFQHSIYIKFKPKIKFSLSVLFAIAISFLFFKAYNFELEHKNLTLNIKDNSYVISETYKTILTNSYKETYTFDNVIALKYETYYGSSGDLSLVVSSYSNDLSEKIYLEINDVDNLEQVHNDIKLFFKDNPLSTKDN